MDGDVDDILLGNTRRALLLLQEVLAGFDQTALGHQTHDLGTGDADATVLCATAHLFKGHVQRRHVDVGDVHRHLSDLVLVDVPADGLGALEGTGLHHVVAILVLNDLAGDGIALAHGAALLAHVKCDGIGPTGRGGVQVVVHSDEEVAGTYCGAARTGHALVKGAVAEVGTLLGVTHLLGQSLILASAAHGQVLAAGLHGSSLIAVAGDIVFAGNALGQFVGQFGTLLKGDAGHGNQRAYIGGTHARVCTVVVTHVDELTGLADSLEGSLEHCVGLTHKGHHCAVGSLAWVHVEQFHALDTFDLIGNLLNNGHIASLTEVRHAFHDFLLHTHLIIRSFSSYFMFKG